MTAPQMLCPVCSATIEVSESVKPAALARQRALRQHLASDQHDLTALAHYAALYLLGGRG